MDASACGLVYRHPLHPPPRDSASEGIGGARGLGNLVRPESHPEPRSSRSVLATASRTRSRHPVGIHLSSSPLLPLPNSLAQSGLSLSKRVEAIVIERCVLLSRRTHQ